MDPLSISFGIAGILPLIAKTITTARFGQGALRGPKQAGGLEGQQLPEYERFLDEAIHGSEVTYLVLNALDECEHENRIEAGEGDIKRNVLKQCDVADIYQIADERFVDRVVGKLTRSASGM